MKKLLTLLLFSTTLLITTLQGQVTFTNSSPITINSVGNANPYPSTISVTGLAPNILSLTVTVTNLSHSWPTDIDVLLVSPSGTSVILFSDAIGGCCSGISNATYTFDMNAPSTLPLTGFPASGTYRPVDDGTSDDFPAPGPGTILQPSPTLADFNGEDPNGTWSLYVVDDAAGDAGSIAGGWSITITESIPCIAPPTAGTTTTTNADPCLGMNFTVGLVGNTIGTGQTYQWQSSPDNSIWSDIVGATNYNYTTSITDTTYYRCILTCSGQSDTSTVQTENLAPFYNCYCNDSYALSTVDEDIDTVRIGNYVNVSPAPTCGSYTNYASTSNAPTVIMGQTYPIGIGTRDCEGTFFYDRYVKVWIDFDHDGVYDNVTELVFEGAATAANFSNVAGSITIPLTAQIGFTGMRVVCNETTVSSNVNPCGTYNWGETEDYLIWVNQVPVNDAGTLTFVSPQQPACTLTDTLKVEITNEATTSLTSADINYSINNGTPSVFNWTGALSPGQTTVVNVGYVNFNDGDMVRVWTSNPNGTSDDYLFNDTIQTTLYEALNGNYTVYGSTPDFNTLNDAVTALQMRGICGDVWFNVRSGNYTEQVQVNTYPTVNNANYWVTIQSEALDASLVKIDYSPVMSTANYVFDFNAVQNVRINELTLSNTSYYSGVVRLNGGTDSIVIENSIIIGDTVAAATTGDKQTIYSNAGTDNNTVIRNNEIWGGSRAMWLWGSSATSVESGLLIDHNMIGKYYQAGVVCIYQKDAVITNNVIHSDPLNGNTNIFHLDIEESIGGAVISGNDVSGVQGGFGINVVGLISQPSDMFAVANNFVYMGNTNSTTYSEGISIQDCSNGFVVFNSVLNRSLTATSAGVRVFNGSTVGITLLNNNIVHTGDGYAINYESPYYIDNSDHNNFYTTGSRYARVGTVDYADLVSLQSATGMDGNSVSVDPNFAGSDLHTCRIELDNAGVPVAGFTTDVDSDTRNVSTPDIGADEFLTTANFTLGNDIWKCPSDSSLLGAEIINNASYYWSPYFQNTPTIYATVSGEYVVQIVSGCGTAIDTIEVFNYPAPNASYSYSTNFYTAVTNNTSSNGISYFWDFGDGFTSTDFEPSHVYVTNGTYNICLTVYSDCGDSSVYCQQVVVNPQFAGVEENDQNSMNIYPNPSDGYFTVSLADVTGDDVQISVMDLSGRTIYSNNFGKSDAQFISTIDIRGVAAGTYFIRLQSGKYSAVSKIIIK